MSEVKVKQDLTASTFGNMYNDSSNNRLVVAPYQSKSSNPDTNYVTYEECAQLIDEYCVLHKDELKGDTGPQGLAGYTPQKGVDYWTETDKQEIISDVLNSLPTAESEVY